MRLYSHSNEVLFSSFRELRVIIIFSLVFTLLNLYPSLETFADLKDCRGLREGGYKVLLDDPRTIDADLESKEKREDFLGQFQFLMENLLEEKDLETYKELETFEEDFDQVVIQYLECPGRSPRKADLDRDEIRLLHRNKAILEVASRLSAKPSGAIIVSEAEIHYFIIPLRHEHFQQAGALDGVYSHKVTPQANAGTGATPDWLSLFKGSPLLEISLFTGLGLQHHREKKYDHAYSSFCNANLWIDGFVKDTLRNKLKRQLRGLQKFVQDRASQVIREAQADPDYNQPSPGTMSLFDAENPCA